MKNWRYRLFATAGKLTHHGRNRRLLYPTRAPETRLIMQILAGVKHFAASNRFTPALVPR